MAAPRGMKDYNRLRRFLEQIYPYGFFSREDFAKAGIGGVKDYDYGAGLLRTLYPELDENARWQDGKKYLRFQRIYEKSGEDRLADSYLLHAIKEEELLQVLCILSACARRPRTLDELSAAVELLGLESEGALYPTVRRRVLELEAYGYLQRMGKRVCMPNSPLTQLEAKTLLALEDYVRFSSGVTYSRVAGSFLRRSIRRELERRGLEERRGSPFLLRGSVKCNLFDEDMVLGPFKAVLSTGRRAYYKSSSSPPAALGAMSCGIPTVLTRRGGTPPAHLTVTTITTPLTLPTAALASRWTWG